MATAKIERALVARGEGCLGKAADDEPIFILRAQDKIAARAVEYWVMQAKMYNVNDAKIDEAELIANAMALWHTRKTPD